MVVDDAEHADRDEAEHPHEREVCAQSARCRRTWIVRASAPAVLVDLGNDIATTDENAPHGLPIGPEAEHALAEPPELPGAQRGLLYVQPHEVGLEVMGVWFQARRPRRASPGDGKASPPRASHWR